MLKKLTLFAVWALLALQVNAQTPEKKKTVIPRGAKMITGNLQLGYSQNASVSRNFSFSVGEQNGFFVTNNFCIGNLVGYDMLYSRSIDGLGGVSVGYGHGIRVGVAMRYYKMFGERFGFFGQWTHAFRVNYRYLTSQSIPNSNTLGYGFRSQLSPNLVYFLTPKLGLEMGFGALEVNYLWAKNQPDGLVDVNLGFNPNLRFGLSWYLGRTKTP